MKKENLFNFLLRENVKYTLKSKGTQRILKEEDGKLELDEESNIILKTSNGKEIVINLEKAVNIDVVEIGEYVNITYAASEIELRKLSSKEEEIDSFIDTLLSAVCNFSISLKVGEVVFYNTASLFNSILEENRIEIETDNCRLILPIDEIEFIKKEYEDDELLYVVKLKNNNEIIFGFMD